MIQQQHVSFIEICDIYYSSSPTAGNDYQPVNSQQLTFSPSITQATLLVVIVHDNLTEPTENFTVYLSLRTDVNNVTIRPDVAIVNILDNDTIGKQRTQPLCSMRLPAQYSVAQAQIRF